MSVSRGAQLPAVANVQALEPLAPGGIELYVGIAKSAARGDADGVIGALDRLSEPVEVVVGRLVRHQLLFSVLRIVTEAENPTWMERFAPVVLALGRRATYGPTNRLGDYTEARQLLEAA